MSDLTGTEIRGHRVVALVGRGSSASVWRATSPEGGEVAIKVLEPSLAQDPAVVPRFNQEGLVQLHMRHPNIARVDAYSPAELAIVMELVPGRTLAEVIAAQAGPMPPAQAMPIIRPILDALDFAHRQGEVHRDLKPANVKITPAGEVRVLDFGIAAIIGGAAGPRAGSTTVMGNGDYLSPEQIKGNPPDARSDVYALGIMLYELLAGRRPFLSNGDDFAVRMAHVEQAPPAPHEIHPDLGERLGKVLLRAIEKDPGKRYPTVNDLRRDLETAAAAEEQARVEWMVRADADSDPIGPVSLDQLERGMKAGKVPDDAQIAREGSEAWEPARAVLQRRADAQKALAALPSPSALPAPRLGGATAALGGSVPQMKTQIGGPGLGALRQMPTQVQGPLFAPPPPPPTSGMPMTHAPTQIGGPLFTPPPPPPSGVPAMRTEVGGPLFPPPPPPAGVPAMRTEVGGPLFPPPAHAPQPMPGMRTEVGGPLFAPPSSGPVASSGPVVSSGPFPAPMSGPVSSGPAHALSHAATQMAPFPPQQPMHAPAVPAGYPPVPMAAAYPAVPMAAAYPAAPMAAGYPAAPMAGAGPMHGMQGPPMHGPMAVPAKKAPVGLLIGIFAGVVVLGLGTVFLVRSLMGGTGGLEPVEEGKFHSMEVLPNGPVGIRKIAGGADSDHVVISRPEKKLIRAEHTDGHGVVTQTDEFRMNDDSLISEVTRKNRYGRTLSTEIWKCESATSCLVSVQDAAGSNAVAPCKQVRITVRDGGVEEETTCVDNDGKPMNDGAGVVTRVEHRQSEGPAKLTRIKTESFDADKNRVTSGEAYVASTEFKLDDNGCVIETAHFDAKGRAMDRPDGYHKEKAERDKECRLLEEALFDADDKPTTDKNGVHRRKLTYDGDDVVEVAYFDADDKPVTSLAFSAHVMKLKRDDRGNITSRSYFDTKGEKRDAGLFHEERMEYDDRDLMVSIARFMADGSPAMAGAHREKVRYDDMGLETERSYFDAAGAPFRPAGAEAPIVRRRYDEMGRQVSMSCWKSDKEAAPCTAGQHEQRDEFDDTGCLTEESYFDAEGKPTALATGIHRYARKNDVDCNVTKIESFGVDGGKAVDESGVHRKLLRYKQGKLISRAMYGADEKPLRVKRVHESRYRYDRRGRLVEETSFGPDDKPVIDARGVHRRTLTYDDLGRLESVSQFDAAGAPAFALADQHIVKYEYDAQGRTLKTSYWGPSEAVSFFMDTRYHAATFTFDAAGRRASEAYWMAADVPGYSSGFSDVHKEEHSYDDNGCEVETRRVGIDGKPAEDYAKIKYTRDNACRATKTTHYDNQGLPTKDDNGVHRYEYKLEHGRVAEERRFDRDDALTPSEVDGAAVVKYSYDANGRVTATRFFDKENAPVKSKGGTVTALFKYDADGNKIEETLMDKDDKPSKTGTGIHRTTFKYDPFGNQIEKAFFKEDGSPASDYAEVHKYVDRRDRFGRVVENAELSTSGKARKDYKGVKIKRTRYDDVGRIASESYWNDEGTAAANGSGIHEERYKLDAEGQLVEKTYFDIDAKPAVDKSEGAHKSVLKRNDDGDIVEWAYFGTAGEPVADTDGHHRIAYKLDPLGNRIEESYWDANGQPAVNAAGTHRLVLARNARGWITGVRWYDRVGIPSGPQRTEGEDERRFVYDARGNWTSMTAWKGGVPMTYERPFCVTGYHEVRRKFNARNMVEQIEYFRGDGSPANAKESCDTAVTFQRIELVYKKDKLVRQDLFLLGKLEKDKTLDCEKGHCMAPGGQNSSWGGR